MFELLTIAVFIWLLASAIKLTFTLTWGAAKIISSILMVLALPILIICLLFVGGIALLIPLAIVGTAAGILRSCVK